MRIIGGAHRGRSIVAPKGHSTRPTADRTRQALFNVLEHAAWGGSLAGRRVLDLFAGSGALGLEALSRGAAFGLLVDNDRDAIAAMTENLSALRLGGACEPRRADAARLGPRPANLAAFDVVFLDPPYAQGLVEPALACLAEGGWLTADALIVAERGAAEPAPAQPGFTVLDDRKWGAARVWFLRPA